MDTFDPDGREAPNKMESEDVGHMLGSLGSLKEDLVSVYNLILEYIQIM